MRGLLELFLLHSLIVRVATLALLLSATAALAQSASPIFVLNSLDANISVIDPSTWKVIKTLPTGKEPHHLYLTPDEQSVIVANAASDSLTFIDPRTAQIQRVVRNTVDPYHLRFSPDMKWFVTVANRVNHIDIYRWDGNTPVLAKRLPSSKTPSHIWIDSKSTTLYASMQESNELVAVDLATQPQRWRIPTGAIRSALKSRASCRGDSGRTRFTSAPRFTSSVAASRWPTDAARNQMPIICPT